MGAIGVTRGGELGRLAAALTDACRGEGAIVFVTGEAGVGKTWMAERLAEAAAERQARVCWGRCHDGEWWPPYGPWLEAAAALDERPDVGGGRFDVYARLAGVFEAASRSRPLVLVLEDVHHADDASLAFLQYAARAFTRLPLLVVATYREDAVGLTHPLNECLTELRRERLSSHVRVEPLDEAGTREMLDGLLGRPVAPANAHAVHRATGGNPFFVLEVHCHLLERGWDLASPVDGIGAGDIPRTVREAVGARLTRLERATVTVLELASAFSGSFAFDVLAAITGLEEDALLDAIDEALCAGLLVPAGDDEYDFAHELVRATLYDALSPSRRARLHRRVAAALERVYLGRELEIAPELALQFHRSRSLPGAAHGIRYARAAASRSSELRERFLRIALDLAEGQEPVARELRAELSAPGPDGLTGREQEVLALLAGGRSNREIAAELVVSDHTVERHVANIYRKIGAHNRAAATAYAYDRGLS